MKDLRTKLILMGLLALLPAYVYACSTPVFRYALERWPADFYDGVLVHRGPIAEGHPAAKLFEGETAEFLNLRLSRMDLDSAAEEDVKNLLGDKVPEKLPALVLWYPWQKGRAAPFWTGEFTPETVAVLIQSATREEVAKRLTEGQAGVWIFVESGDKAKDKAALELLKKELETVTKELMEFAPPVEEADTPGISFEFSTVSLSRTDPNERALLSIIMLGGATAQTLTGGGAVFNNVTVTNNSAAVTFAGGLTSTVFVCQTPGAALTFEKDAVFACANLTLTAPTNNRIVLRSSQNGQQWKLNVSGWSAVRGA
ncbi:MAG: hypothetical protein H8E73_04335, partial [Planctomycetes bacterium]|nr:hypothetical protein [Planctomycetota bacterium]